MDWSTLFGIAGMVVGLVSATISIVNAKSSARKGTVDTQAQIIDDLSETYDRQGKVIEDLAKSYHSQSKIVADLRSAYNGLSEENQALRKSLDVLKKDYDRLKTQYDEVYRWAFKRGYRQGDVEA